MKVFARALKLAALAALALLASWSRPATAGEFEWRAEGQVEKNKRSLDFVYSGRLIRCFGGMA
jgi:hypothetical protein